MLSFAALASRVNTAVLDRLADAVASIAGGLPVPVLFDQDYQVAGVGELGMAAGRTVVQTSAHHVPDDAVGLRILVDRVGPGITSAALAYVIDDVQPAGDGMVTVFLGRG
ncbi:hypothetical protein GN316_15360 [Xylophilus sp. Kf1]|nr:hypothetical protein [Xylophilus sp. Kf1]